MRISLFMAIASGFVASAALANDSVSLHNREFRQIVGAAGQPAQTDDAFGHNNGGYQCKNATTRATPHIVRYPFTLPDSRKVAFVNVYGRRTSDAPPMEASVLKACMSQDETAPTVTTLATGTASGNADGYFIMVLHADDVPNNLNCRYWAEVRFDISSIPCTTGTAYVQRVFLEATVPDRIFRGMFNTNAPFDVP